MPLCIKSTNIFVKMSGFADLFDINKGDTDVPTFFEAKKPKNPNQKRDVKVTGLTDFRGLCSPPSRQKTQTKKVRSHVRKH